MCELGSGGMMGGAGVPQGVVFVGRYVFGIII